MTITQEPRRTLRLFVVDDHRIFTDLLSMALEADQSLQCIGLAASAPEARRLADSGADVALIDVHLKDEDGIELCSDLRTSHPELQCVILTADARPSVAARAARAGATAFLAKDGDLSSVLKAVRSARSGRFQVSADLLSQMLAREQRPALHTDLTDRERRVLALFAEGKDVRETSVELGLSLHTTRGYAKELYRKLGVHTQLSAVVTAQKLGLLPRNVGG